MSTTTESKSKLFETDLPGVNIIIDWEETEDRKPIYWVEGHGMHPIDESTLEKEITSIVLMIDGIKTTLTKTISKKEKEFLINQLD